MVAILSDQHSVEYKQFEKKLDKYLKLEQLNAEMLEVLKKVYSMCPYDDMIHSVIKSIIEKAEGMKRKMC